MRTGLIVTGARSGMDAVLRVGSEFESDEEAYKLYRDYARAVGFSVRKDWVNRSKVHGQVVSRKFTCSRQGYRRRDKRDVNVRKHRKETRTGCLAHLVVTRQPGGRYRVASFEERHNHDDLNLDDSNNDNIRASPLLRESSVDRSAEAMSRQFRVCDSRNVEFDCHLQTERVRDMKEGEAGRLIHYFQRRRFENPSFFYALQVDVDDKVSNIFWSDDYMVSDYGCFGDVVCLDTICRTTKDHFPFVQFIGLNHHKQAVIFGAALLYDDTVESFKWLFRTFLEVMSGIRPKAIHTDHDVAIIEAIHSVLPEVDHSICVWQMYENGIKHISDTVIDTESFGSDLKRCIYETKDEEDFARAWDDMLNKHILQQNEWLKWMFREREKWAVVYGRNTFFVDAKGVHIGEMLFNDLRNYLNYGLGVIQFLKHFEMVVEEQRYKEIEANDEMDRCKPRLMANVVMLKHAINIYTPRAFEVFQRGYEKCLNVVVNQCGENGSLFEYKANKLGLTREFNITFDSSDDSVLCSCKKFDCVGFLCSHALKVLDHRNIKLLPSKYISKRWSKDARLRECDEVSDKDNPRMTVATRYRDLCRRLLTLSARASKSDEAFLFASRQIDEVVEGVEKILVRSKPVETQAVMVESESDQPSEIFLDGNPIKKQTESGITKGNSRTIADRVIGDVETLPWCISSSTPVDVSPQIAVGNPIMQGLYCFEANQVIKCIYQQQPNLVIDPQTNSDIFQASSFITNQHDSSCQSQLLQEPLIDNPYPESISNTTELRQEMDLDNQHPHSLSFVLFDQRYRAPDSTFLGPNEQTTHI